MPLSVCENAESRPPGKVACMIGLFVREWMDGELYDSSRVLNLFYLYSTSHWRIEHIQYHVVVHYDCFLASNLAITATHSSHSFLCIVQSAFWQSREQYVTFRHRLQ